MKRFYLIFFALLIVPFLSTSAQSTMDGTYTVVIDAYDWGPGVNKVIIRKPNTEDRLSHNDFEVKVVRSKENVEMRPSEAEGIRKVLYAYPSNADGDRDENGLFTTLVLLVAPNDPLSSPIKYYRSSNGRASNQWIDYKLTVTHVPSGTKWNKEGRRIIPDLDIFHLNGSFSHKDIDLTYGSFTPEGDGMVPLIIWLHGGGEGGTDASIPLIANKATNYASEEIQEIFKGAYVLAPQTPTFWMQSESGEYTRGNTNDIYNEALMALITDFVKKNPKIDSDRIYIGGCSNGGYMSLKLLLNHPDYFAAGYISALAYHNEYISDEQLNSIKNIPIWFVHSKDDTTTIPEETVIPLYERLVDAGAPNVHLSLYDHVIDLNGMYGGEDYHFPGHWSWIYSHDNDADFDYDGTPVLIDSRPVTIMEWLAQQHK
ncbi:glucan-binding protein [Maribacter algicola]|uniref:Glucan-binding protein n=1 Tax=Maribacter algicola TaxID=2498892 RepID=A0A3R8PXX1_9FLAO|nr:prolyl oligopeptidase family serine peptidase [Maribacter algicola]RRQ48356.1 glucan-binding protein [Maribacter algicola]